MASSKRKLFNDDPVELCGYPHDLTDVSTSGSGSVRYFTGQFQTGKNEVKRLVAFSPEKHRQFAQAQNTPVKLKNPVLKAGRHGETEVIVNKYTLLEVCSQPLPFTKSQVLPTAVKEAQFNLTDLDKKDVLATVIVKVLGFITDTKTVRTRYGEKDMRTALVADNTKTVKATFWQDYTSQITTSSSYKITNMITKYFDGSLCINTTSNTVITQVAPLHDVKDDINQHLMEKTMKVQLQQINISESFKCANSSCSKQINVDTSDRTIRCEECKMKQNKSFLTRLILAKLVVKDIDTNEVKSFKMFEEPLQTFVVLHEQQHLMSDLDRLEDFLLDFEQLFMTHTANSTTITKLATTNDQASANTETTTATETAESSST